MTDPFDPEFAPPGPGPDCPDCTCCTADLCTEAAAERLPCLFKCGDTDPATLHRVAACPCTLTAHHEKFRKRITQRADSQRPKPRPQPYHLDD
jgi:hypothetical protein